MNQKEVKTFFSINILSLQFLQFKLSTKNPINHSREDLIIYKIT